MDLKSKLVAFFVAVGLVPHSANASSAPRAYRDETALLMSAKTVGGFLTDAESSLDKHVVSFLKAKTAGLENQAIKVEKGPSGDFLLRSGKLLVLFRIVKQSADGIVLSVNNHKLEFTLSAKVESVWDQIASTIPQKTSSTNRSLLLPEAKAFGPYVAYLVSAVLVLSVAEYFLIARHVICSDYDADNEKACDEYGVATYKRLANSSESPLPVEGCPSGPPVQIKNCLDVLKNAHPDWEAERIREINSERNGPTRRAPSNF